MLFIPDADLKQFKHVHIRGLYAQWHWCTGLHPSGLSRSIHINDAERVIRTCPEILCEKCVERFLDWLAMLISPKTNKMTQIEVAEKHNMDLVKSYGVKLE